MVEAPAGGVGWLWLAAGLYLLFEMWRGWRRGVVRHGVSVMALLVSGGIGYVFAWMTGWLSDRVIPLTPPTGRFIFGFAAGLAFYLAAVVLSSLLFKKTSQQSSGMVRLFYGAGGAFFGVIFGLLVLWGGISMVRVLGAVAQGQHAAAENAGFGPRVMDEKLAGMKESLEAGATGQLVDRVDIVPANVYGLLTKLIQVTQSPDAMARFLAYPGTQTLLTQPKVAALFNDLAANQGASESHFLALLTSPKLAEVAGDPEVQKSFAGFDLEKALDYALQQTPTSPAHEH
jgi:hypothetical protein